MSPWAPHPCSPLVATVEDVSDLVALSAALVMIPTTLHALELLDQQAPMRSGKQLPFPPLNPPPPHLFQLDTNIYPACLLPWTETTRPPLLLLDPRLLCLRPSLPLTRRIMNKKEIFFILGVSAFWGGK